MAEKQDNGSTKGVRVKEDDRVLGEFAASLGNPANVACRIEKFGNVVDNLSPSKDRWVTEMGFDGLLNLVGSHLPRSLCCWLATRVDCEKKAMGGGLERNLSSLDSERLAVHSSRVSPTRPRSSEYHIPRNISCPVSPIGSPLLHPRSPQHLNGMMSPSPISGPRTTSGSSTPLTGGSGAIPFHHSQQSLYMHEGFGALSKSPNSVFLNGPCYHNPNPNSIG